MTFFGAIKKFIFGEEVKSSKSRDQRFQQAILHSAPKSGQKSNGNLGTRQRPQPIPRANPNAPKIAWGDIYKESPRNKRVVREREMLYLKNP